jgi:hypothetical protein
MAAHPSMRPDIMARRQAQFDGARTQLDVERLEARWRQEDIALEAAETVQAQELHELRQRVASLEQVVRPMIQQRGIFDTMHARLHALEQRPAVQYRGVFDETRQYQQGDMVSHNGSVWHCNSACAGQRPHPPPTGPWRSSMAAMARMPPSPRDPWCDDRTRSRPRR